MGTRAERGWLTDYVLWVEAFVLVNFAFLVADIYIAHSSNQFRDPREYVPLFFSLVAPAVLLAGLILRAAHPRIWKWTGFAVGWCALATGLAGVVFHLDAQFFYEKTLRSLAYGAPFAAPLAYAGLGLLLLVNRMVDAESAEWSRWIILLALGGFFGNFVLSLTDHAVNGFFRWEEWIPVVSSAFATGFLAALFFSTSGRRYLVISACVVLAQGVVGIAGFLYHLQASLEGPGNLWYRIVNGAPLMAPLLFPNLVLLALIGIWVLDRKTAAPAGSTRSAAR